MSLLSHRTSRNASEAGFTLVELLLVVAILGILATVAVTNLSGQGEKAKIQAQRTSLDGIKTAIGAYETSTTSLPQSLDDLTKDQADGLPPLIEKNKLVDQWGNTVQYKKEGKYKFKITSAGPDGKMGSEDDIWVANY